MTTRVLLVDDHELMREALCTRFAKDDEFEVVAEAGDGRTAVELAAARRPDVVIMDVSHQPRRQPRTVHRRQRRREPAQPEPACWPGRSPVLVSARRSHRFRERRFGNPEICIVEIASGEVINVTRNPARDGQPAWSPDGREIAFVSDRDGEASMVYLQAMLDAGALGYVVKTSIARDLVPAIRSIAAGKRYLSPEIDGLDRTEETP